MTNNKKRKGLQLYANASNFHSIFYIHSGRQGCPDLDKKDD
jgi:hypothetical protein